jgi:glycosidase
MYVIIDWVANHTSWDNSLTISHPEWYLKDGNGNFIPPPGTNWKDVIQLDYSKQGLRDYMINAMKFWITEADIDGFRCDAVSFMPLDFWTTAINELKIIKPEILMLAEDDGTQYPGAGFDMSYGWGLYGFGNGILVKIVNGTNNANFIRSYSSLENTNYPPSHYRMYFTSNHDENSLYGTVYELFGDAAESFAVLVSIFRSMPLIYGGQEAGLNHRLAFFDKDEIIWQPHPLAEIYKSLLHLKKNNKALWNGTDGGLFERVTTTNNPAIIAFVRQKENHKLFAVFNLTDSAKTFTLQGSLYTGNYRDVFTNDSVLFNENTEMTLQGWDYKVYETGSGITGIEEEATSPRGFILYQNYPNPFNPTTKIKFSIPSVTLNGGEGSKVILKVYDILGKEIKTLVNEEKVSGKYEVDFDAGDLASGVYIYRIHVNDFVSSKKMLLLH